MEIGYVDPLQRKFELWPINSVTHFLDSEYADDAMLYLHGNDANVHKAEGQMDLFCKVGELIGTKVEDSG